MPPSFLAVLSTMGHLMLRKINAKKRTRLFSTYKMVLNEDFSYRWQRVNTEQVIVSYCLPRPYSLKLYNRLDFLSKT